MTLGRTEGGTYLNEVFSEFLLQLKKGYQIFSHSVPKMRHVILFLKDIYEVYQKRKGL